MIKKIMLMLGATFVMMVGGSTLNSVSANTTTVKAEVVSRNLEKHTIKVETNDGDTDKITLKNVSAAQMDVANKGSIINVTYDDKFNLLSLEKVSGSDNTGFPKVDGATVAILVPVVIVLVLVAFVATSLD